MESVLCFGYRILFLEKIRQRAHQAEILTLRESPGLYLNDVCVVPAFLLVWMVQKCNEPFPN
jgi:hypothetical protein